MLMCSKRTPQVAERSDKRPTAGLKPAGTGLVYRKSSRLQEDSRVQEEFSFTRRVLVYRKSSHLQEEFSFTGRVLVYRMSSRLLDEFLFTGRVFVFRKSSRVQDEFSFTGRVFVH